MTIRMIQGFEHILPTTPTQAQVLPDELRRFMHFLEPVNQTNWFDNSVGGVSDASGPMIIDSDYRIDGQSLRIKRPKTDGGSGTYNQTYAMDLSIEVRNSNRVTFGFAVKYNKAPDVPIPLVQWLYDNVSSEDEQASLWVGTNGRMYFSSVDFNIATTSIITPTAIAQATSAQGVFNFLEWQYIEVDLDYSASVPKATVYVNGLAVIEAETAELLKTASTFFTKQSIINPQNTYFPLDDYIMYVDDIYSQEGANPVLGPQHIVLLQPDSTAQNAFVITGGAAASWQAVNGLFNKSDLTDYITNDAADDEEILGLENTPASLPSITAVAMGWFNEVDSGSQLFRAKFISAATPAKTQEQLWSVSETVPFFGQFISELAPDGGAWDSTKLDDTQLAIEIR